MSTIYMETDRPSKKARRSVEIDTILATQMDAMCDAKRTKFKHEVNVAVREHLERNGFWPPPQPAPADSD